MTGLFLAFQKTSLKPLRHKNMLIKKSISMFARYLWTRFFPESYAKYVYKKTTGEKLDLRNPRNFYEKNFWLRVYSDLSQWTELADKYKVRDYVKQCGLGDILVKLYGVWDRAADIDFNQLPDKFVLKATHGYSKIILVPDKSALDIEKAKNKLNTWLKEKYGLVSFEPHCLRIQRKIIAEEYLEDNSKNAFSSSLIDYKFFCINGEPEIIKVMFNRKYDSTESKTKTSFKTFAVDLDWNVRHDLISDPHKNAKSLSITKPRRLEEMLKIAKILSSPFPQVRVDLYEVNDKVYFGELTFTPGGSQFFTPEYLKKMGEKMDLSPVKLRTKRFIV